MKGGMDNLMKQAQQLQANMQKAQAELASLEVTGEAGGGMVAVVMTGTHEVRRVTFDPNASLDDREMLEDLVAAAVNDATRKIDSQIQERFSGLAQGLGLPPGMMPG
jgi:DNA-binding YbaB/EbfC family protein